MRNPVALRILLFITGLILVPSLTYLVILFARGYRPGPTPQTLQPTGLLVSTSVPDGAQIYINGRLSSATNSTTNLAPGEYTIEIKKASFSPWLKRIKVEAEIVTRASATLFPSVPVLKAITTSGASSPHLSPDGSKIIFTNQGNLYTLDLNESPLGLISREPKLLSTLGREPSTLVWSPDSRQILINNNLLLDVNTSQITNASASAVFIANGWKQRQVQLEQQKFITLPPRLQDTLATAAADLIWSPRENRLLYTATASAIIPDELKKPLPGSSTQIQERNITPNHLYVYDLEEDRNFRLPSPGWTWFPTSSHLIKSENRKVTIIEYDAQNPTVVYEGPMQGSFAAPYPSGKQLLILTNLNPTPRPSESPTPPKLVGDNLYAVSLR